MTEEKKETYTTSDIGIAAYLQLFNIRLLQCHRLEGGRFFFEFGTAISAPGTALSTTPSKYGATTTSTDMTTVAPQKK